MSAALFERAAAGRHRALSAGTTPATRVHPEVVEVMSEPPRTSVPAAASRARFVRGGASVA
jgi:protein-tyrosine-phosphatase